METFKKLILKLWDWLKGQTDIDGKIKETFEEVERRYSRVKEEIKDVKKSTSEVLNQIDDVAKAVGGSNRKGRKPSTKKITKSALRAMKKDELLETAKNKFKMDLDSKLTKSNLVNKVYELYHKK
jgi:ferritin-like metal-binding protein YciE